MTDTCRVNEISREMLERTAEIWRRKAFEYSYVRDHVKTAIKPFTNGKFFYRGNTRVERSLAFKKALLRRLIQAQSRHGKPISHKRAATVSFPLVLTTSAFGNDLVTRAAIAARIPGTWLPPASYTSFEKGCLCVEFAGEPRLYHYPTSSGWLVCALHGDDMPKIIDAFEAGLLPHLHAETQE